ncbi:SET domain-containing protein [bacterium]|nr:SET domain-containing protein [bacterium]
MNFKERFNITPPVKYIEEESIRKSYIEDFHKKYKAFYKKYKPTLSKTRKKQFDAYFRRLARDGNDLHYCSRVSLKYISKQLGHGIFAKEDIAPYSVLCHYVGEIIPTKNLKVEHDSTFSFEHFEPYSIDAMKKGNWARFMNHSDLGTPSNNVTVWEYYTEDGPKIFFTAGPRGIKKGAQLLYSYGEEYWENKKALDLL